MTLCEQDIQRTVREMDPHWTLDRLHSLGGRASALHIATGAATSARLVLLTHSQRDRQRNPHIARDEFRLLKALRGTGLPAPAALHLNETHHPPYLITAFAEGSSRFHADRLDAFCRQLANSLHAIHAVSLGERDLSFLPPLDEAWIRAPLSPNLERNRLMATLQRHWHAVDLNPPALLHGDFWLGNLLWRGDRLTAIIDWEDAMRGDPLADLGKSRLEILWALGADAMRLYTNQYMRLNDELDATALPFWDLWGASRLSHFASFASEPSEIPRMQAQYEAFCAAAMQKLSKSS